MGSQSLNAGSLWRLAIDRLRSKVDPTAFESWLNRPVECSIEDGVLLVSVPNMTVADTLDRRFGYAVRSAISEVVGYSIDVQFLSARRQEADVRDARSTSTMSLEEEVSAPVGEGQVGQIQETRNGARSEQPMSPDQLQPEGYSQPTLFSDQFFISAHSHGKLRQKTFDTFREDIPGVQGAVIEAMEFAIDPCGSLLIVGPKDAGKTHLAAATTWSCFERGSDLQVFFAEAKDLFSLLQSFFGSAKSDAYSALFHRICDTDLLVLDNVMHPPRVSGEYTWFDEVLYLLLSHRIEVGRMTVLTARPECLMNLDAGLISRLSDPSRVRTAVIQTIK
jgi:chromosomal replication initiation ATPase DnaA